MKRRFRSLAIAMMLIMAFGVVVSAAIEQNPLNCLKKTYTVVNAGTLAPAETFNFTVENVSAKDTNTVTKDTMPSLGTTATATFAEGLRTSKTVDLKGVELPEYSEVGIYTYKVSENKGNTAGVTYDDHAMYVVVTVTNKTDEAGNIVDGFNTTVTAHYGAEKGEKDKPFENEYKAGMLNVEKDVKGVFGDVKKTFKVDITLTAEAGKEIKNIIAVGDKDNVTEYTPDQWKNGSLTVTVEVKDGVVKSVANIPYGTTYTVAEHDYSNDGYEVSYDNNQNGTINAAETDTVITNSKGGTVDTGLIYNNLPYAVLILVSLAAVVFFITKRKSVNDDL